MGGQSKAWLDNITDWTLPQPIPATLPCVTEDRNTWRSLTAQVSDMAPLYDLQRWRDEDEDDDGFVGFPIYTSLALMLYAQTHLCHNKDKDNNTTHSCTGDLLDDSAHCFLFSIYIRGPQAGA